MANPYYDNSDNSQRFQPGTTVRAGEVDAKFDAVAAGFDANNVDVERAIKLPDGAREITDTALQRRNRIVGFGSDGNLETQAAPLWRGDWATGTEYQVNHYFRDPASKNIYVTVERHTSGTLADDITAGRVKEAINVVDVENATIAAETAQAAAESAQQASESARDASQSARDASQSAQLSSESARDKSAAWAEKPEDVQVEPGKFSALHHAAKASKSESAAASSANSASSSASLAANSANSASSSATAAASSATSAATSESNAATSESNAATSESNAAASESNAAASESNAAASESNAAASESNAAASEEESQRIEDYLSPLVNYTAARTAISWHANAVVMDVTVPPNQNAFSFGPVLTIAPNATVTVPDSSNWTIV